MLWARLNAAIRTQIILQVARPSADHTDGNWTDAVGNNTALYASIDEAVTDDGDYIQSEIGVETDICRVKLGSLSDPSSSTDHTVTYRAQSVGDGAVNLTVRLIQGASTVIASWVHTDLSFVLTTYTQTLSGAEADSITDYSDLYLEFEKST
jgi:hypothetical protein